MTYDAAINFLQQSDPILGQFIEQIGPCQVDAAQQYGDLFSSLSRAIIHQQLSTKAAASIYHRFLQLAPNKPFPTALDILNAPVELLHSVGLSRTKVLYLKDLAHKILNGLPVLLKD